MTTRGQRAAAPTTTGRKARVGSAGGVAAPEAAQDTPATDGDVAPDAPADPATATTMDAPSARKPARYRTIAAAIAERIKIEELAPGSMLPSEAELSDEFGVTRMTVRHALAGLASAGIIERRHGRGTIVAPIKLQRRSPLPLGLTDELRGRGLTPGSRVLEFDEIAPSPEDRALLWMGPRGTAFRLLRLRYASGVLIGLQETLIPTKFLPGIDRSDFEDESIFRVLRERHGLIPIDSDAEVAATVADRRIAKALDIDVGSAILHQTSVTYLDGGRPLERTIGWFIGSRYSYRIRQTRP